MKPTSIVTLVAATLLAVGSAYWLDGRELRKPYPKAAPPPPSPIYTPSQEYVQSAAEIARVAQTHNASLALEIERALVARDSQERETAFTFLLPELIQVDPERVVAIVARQEPGEARDTIRDEGARQWITRDRDAAIKWMKSFPSDAERHASASTAVASLAAIAPEQAIYVADEFGIGRDDGYLEHMVQIWATENMDEASRWIDAQPAGPKTDQLRMRIDQVRQQTQAAQR
jgi:hypothetical protein